jgi:two-component system, chemotaxis family, sensor kinase CheA
MELKFDIDQDELPIFLAETDEHLQVLDEGLIRLEQEGDNTELVQALFRAAHTLKGSSGMIGHKRMVTVTHALENALDGVRKQQVTITTAFVDLCLEAVDALRMLRQEVTLKQTSEVDVERLAGRFGEISLSGGVESPPKVVQPSPRAIEVKPVISESATFAEDEIAGYFKIKSEISVHSVASAARAFQILMALQDMGEISEMQPSQEEIETARPVHTFSAFLQTDITRSEILKSLSKISELESVNVEPVKKIQKVDVPEVAQVIDQGQVVQTPEKKAIERSPDVQKALVAETKNTSEKMVRTSVERLDNLMNLVGELITDRNRLYQIRGQFETTLRSDQRVDVLSETVTHIGRITDQLQKEVMSIRMLPVANTFHKFPRMVRDLANKFNKKVDLVIEGEDTELDRSVIEEITDPLIHLIRNSLDHGI